jgi:tetratricopeptide (TPR) repeat protein
LEPFLKIKSKSNQFAYLYNLFNIAEIYYLLNNYQKAKPIIEDVLELAMKHSGTTTENYSTPLYLLAKVNYSQGEFELAKEQFERVRQYQEEQYDKLHTKLIHTYSSIGNILRINNKINEELVFLDTIQPIADKSIIFNKEITKYIMTNKKKALLDLKKYDSLIDLLQNELTEVEKKNGDQSPEYSEVLHEIAKVYKASSNFIKALEYYLRARKLKEKQLDIPNNNYVKTIANIAYLYKKDNKTKEGISTYHKALRDIDKSIGNDNVTYAFAEYYATLFDYELLSHYNFNSLKAIILKMIEIKKNIDKTKQNQKESDIVRISINSITNKHSKEYPELQKLNPVISEPHSALSNPDVSIEGY